MLPPHNALDRAAYGVRMFMSVMVSKRKQRRASEGKEQGEFLAGWLNHFESEGYKKVVNYAVSYAFRRRRLPRDDFKRLGLRIKGHVEAPKAKTPDSETVDLIYRVILHKTFPYRLIMSFLESERITWKVRREGVTWKGRWQSAENFPGLEAEFLWKGFLDHIRNHDPSGKHAVELDTIRLPTSNWPLEVDAVFKRGPNGRIALELAPKDDYARTIIALARLLDLGNASRIRRCRACGRFFYAWPRADRKDCSLNCKTANWERTDRGRKYKAAKMREYRANPIVRARNAPPNRYQRKRGRNVHVSLKKGE